MPAAFGTLPRKACSAAPRPARRAPGRKRATGRLGGQLRGRHVAGPVGVPRPARRAACWQRSGRCCRRQGQQLRGPHGAHQADSAQLAASAGSSARSTPAAHGTLPRCHRIRSSAASAARSRPATFGMPPQRPRPAGRPVGWQRSARCLDGLGHCLRSRNGELGRLLRGPRSDLRIALSAAGWQ